MKRNVMLTIASLLSILFMTFHLTDDIVRGMEPGTLSNLIAVPILVVWLYGTLVLAESALSEVRLHEKEWRRGPLRGARSIKH